MKHVCVFGAMRSGKTLLGRALNSHPAVTLQNEPYFFFFKLCRNIFMRDVVGQPFDPGTPVGIHIFQPTKIRADFVKAFPDLHFNAGDIAELKRMTIWQQESEGDERAPRIIPHLDLLREGDAAAVFETLMAILAKAHPKDALQYTGFSEGWVEAFIEPLLIACNRDIRILHVVRDPRAVIASRNAGMDVKKKYGGKYPILFLIRQWRKGVAALISQKARTGYLALRYEDLVRAPEKIFDKIFKFLQIPFDAAVLRTDRYVNGAGLPWKQNTNFKPASGFSTKSIDRWKTVLKGEEIALIESLCLPEMSYLGYKPTVAGADVASLWPVAENDADIVDWLKPYALAGSRDALSLEMVRRELLHNGNHLSDAAAGYLFHEPSAYAVLKQEMEQVRHRRQAAQSRGSEK